ncbi:MAG: S8 family peptidase [Lachnospira sp.]
MNQKADNLLNASLSANEETIATSPELKAGFDSAEGTWEVVFTFAGRFEELSGKYPDIRLKELSYGYATGVADRKQIARLEQDIQINFIEKPRVLYRELYGEMADSCINILKNTGTDKLNGRGVIVAVIDTGIDILDRDFIGADGKSRISSIYDQTTQTEYDNDRINEMIENYYNQAINSQPDTIDLTGHGTNVAKICCGNNGVASESEIVIVKMGTSKNAQPRTNQLMEAVDYCYRYAVMKEKPLAVNVSYGSNYGDHLGNSLLDSFLNDISRNWKMSICVGTGNEGAGATHFEGKLTDNQWLTAEFGVGAYENTLDIQVWKSFQDNCTFEIVNPNGEVLVNISDRRFSEPINVSDNTNRIYVFNSPPGPSNASQEIFINISGRREYISSGTWKIRLLCRQVMSGRVDMWLPVSSALNFSTGFLKPSPEFTFTIPSTATRVISVGAYNQKIMGYAAFSGRGYSYAMGNRLMCKPELVAPGVDILLERRLYNNSITTQSVTGTSFATPFVTGAAALLLEWGIVNGNDLFLYGDKLKEYLISGAKPILSFFGQELRPNDTEGWGRLCLYDSLYNSLYNR